MEINVIDTRLNTVKTVLIFYLTIHINDNNHGFKTFFKTIVMLLLETLLFGLAYEYRFDKMFDLNSVSRVELLQVHGNILPEHSFYAIFYSIKRL